ncbi:hypothetical protein HFO21_07945 [Rhizobium laguerreae]|uniref:ATP-binding protein n=1 Tax=Rhizobium laguerreae TaxID=1076926 RepID=UPI001C9061FE|nr:ATP-binding protein [Rhizobium laguerreae]MBY3214305.1 hypothetical protein [Rhizobium laguerreae]
MISFSSLLSPESSLKTDRVTTEAVALRLALALRGWVNPMRLLPKDLSAPQEAKILDAVAPDVQIALRDQPGRWFLRDQERQRLLATTPWDELERAIEPRDDADKQDPVRQALELRRKPVPSDLSGKETEVLTALGSTFTWLAEKPNWQTETLGFWGREADIEGVKQRVAATLARRRRKDDVERMTRAKMRGRDDQLDRLAKWATAPRQGTCNGRFLYLSGIGGAGKSTLFAHLEKRLWGSAVPPPLVHIDCDTPGFDPTDPIALDLALFPQLAIALPAEAPDMMRRAHDLSRATGETDADYLASMGKPGRGGRLRKAEANRPVESYVDLESASTQKAGERSSISDNALSVLGDRILVLLFDTAELMLARAAVATSSEVAGTTDWLESLTGLMNGYDVRVLMAGRNPPSDAEVDALTRRVALSANWQVDPAMVLGDLEEKEAEALLVDLGIDDPILATKAAKVLPRTPLILKIAADVYGAGEAERAEFIARIEAASIDASVARRYLTERIVNHLASPAAKPYALAAMVLPRVTEPLLVAAVLTAVGSATPSPRLAREVLAGLGDAGWLVREEPGGKSLTFHPEVRHLALELMASDPDLAQLLEEVRRLARDYHSRRRRAGDSTFRAYYDLLLGAHPPRVSTLDLNLLGGAVDDLPQAVRKQFAAPRGGRATSAVPPTSSTEWAAYVEGSGRRDGEGDRLVKRGHPDTALELYRGRPTRPLGLPPTFVLQALADAGYFASADVDIEAVVAEAKAELAKAAGERLGNSVRSRIYWLTRYTLMARPGPLSEAHHAVLGEAARRFSGVGPVLLFPSMTSVAEAFAPKRGPIAPDVWFSIKGAIESETRMFLVHQAQFDRRSAWQPHIDALFALQPDWPELAARGLPRDVGYVFERWMQELQATVFPPNAEPGTQVDFNRFLRILREPVFIELNRKTTRANAVRLLRGMTKEFHRPLRAAVIRNAAALPGAGERLIDLTVEMLGELPLRTRELQEAEWRRRAERDIGAAIGLAIPFIDRSRRLPSFCERLVRAAGRSKTGAELAAVARSFLEWDKALSGGLNSDWKRLTRGGQ